MAIVAHQGRRTPRPPDGGRYRTTAALTKFLTWLPDMEIRANRRTGIQQPEQRLVLAVLEECMDSLKRRLPPPEKWKKHAERRRDLSWVHGLDVGYGYSFAQCVGVLSDVLGTPIGMDAAREALLMLENTEPAAVRNGDETRKERLREAQEKGAMG